MNLDTNASCTHGSSQMITAWLEFASVVCAALLFTPLHPKLLNFKFLSRPWSLAQEPWAGRRKHCRDPSPSKETLLIDQDRWWRPVSLAMVGAGFAFACLWLGFWQCSTPPTTRGSLPAGSGLPSPGWEAVRHSSAMVLLVNFPFS